MILQSPEDSTKISSLYTCVPKITITWCMVPDLGNFLPCYHPLPPPYIDPKNQIFDKKWKKMPWDIILLYIHVYHNEDHMTYGSWNKRCNRQKFLLFHDIFFALSDPWHPEKSKFYHWEKTPGNIIILLMCNKNDSHMMNGSWDIKHNRHNFLSFWIILCPFTQKIKISKKKKKMLRDITILHKCDINDNPHKKANQDLTKN